MGGQRHNRVLIDWDLRREGGRAGERKTNSMISADGQVYMRQQRVMMYLQAGVNECSENTGVECAYMMLCGTLDWVVAKGNSGVQVG